ncbi:MAG: PAS domain S-box protein, partial [Cyanobacteria bacterium J06641_5]
ILKCTIFVRILMSVVWTELAVSPFWQTDDLEAVLAALDRGDAAVARQQLQQALDWRQRLTPQADSTSLHEHQYEAIATTLPTAIFQTDLKGVWTFLNPAWTELCGYSLEESFGSSAFNFLKPVGQESRSWEALHDLLAGRRETLRCEVRCRSKQAKARRLDFAAKRLYGPDGEAIGVVGTLADITERCQYEDHLHAVAETVPGLVSWVSRDGDYLGVNQRLADVLQRDPAEFVGKSIGFLSGNQAFCKFSLAFLESSATHTSEILETETNGVSHRYSIAGQKYQQGNAAVFVGIDITQSQQAERALRESEARFRQLAEHIEQVFWMRDLASDKMIYVSPAYERTWGQPLSTAYESRAWVDAVHLEDRPHAPNALSQQIRGEYDIEYRILRPGGEVRWIHDRAFPVRDDRGQVYRLAGIAEDITERKRAKATLETRERYLSALVDMQRHLLAAKVDSDLYDEVLAILGRVADVGTIYVYENAPDGQPGARLRAQWQVEPARSSSEVSGNTTAAAAADIAALPVQLEAYAQFSPSWSQSLQHGELVNGAVSELDPSERAFFQGRGTRWVLALPLLVAGEFFGFIGFESSKERATWDPLVANLLGSAAATLALARERQLNQEALRQQLTAIEASTDGIFIINPEGQLRYVNPAYHRILGYNTVASPLGSDWQLAYPAETLTAAKTSLRVGGRWSGEVVIQRLDGSTLVAELSLTVTRDREIVGVCRDISERKQAEETLKASLEEKELLLKEVHHRVKNNLQVISSLFNLSAHTIEDPDALAVLAESQNRIASMALIHGKLYQSENLSNIDFAEYIRDLIQHLLASYNADPSRIQTELNVESIALNLDAAIPCGLLFSELISNALKHAFPDRRLGQLQINFANAPEENIILRVADNGIGLPAGFDPDQCSTLGLSLIAALTQQLRGSLKMYNDSGATFEIVFPQPIERKRF